MLTSKLYQYLSPHLPAQVLTLLSILSLTAEKVLLPKLYQIYSNASLDPHTLLPFLFSVIALYLSVVSIYHTLRASVRLVWFGIKWSILLVILWFVLGAVNEMGGHPHTGRGTRTGESGSSGWWSPSNWNRPSTSSESLFDPLKLFLGQGLSSFLDPSTLFDSFLTSPSPDPRSSNSDSRSRTQSEVPPLNDLPYGATGQKVWTFLVQNLKEPVLAIVREAKSQASQTQRNARTSNR